MAVPNTKQQKLLNKVVFSAGFDYQSNPILVICPSRLSASAAPIDFSLLTHHALASFSSVVSGGPYTLIIFASPSEHSPSLKQLISSYQLIDQRIRKNLHSLLVVHPSFWSKITLQVFFKTIVSSKVSRKLKWVKDLSALASLVPIHQICIPPEVYKHDLTVEPAILIPPSSRQSTVFGTDLDASMGSDSKLELPQIIKDCAHCIRSSGLKSEGIFRRPPSLATTHIIRDAYDRRQTIKIEDYPDAPFLAASLIKLFLRELPDPLFSPKFYPVFKTCPFIHLQPLIVSKLCQSDLQTSNEPVLQYVKDHILSNLGKPARTLLDCVLKLSHDLALHSEHNKMDPRNLATCLAPTMIRSNDLIADAMMCKPPSASSARHSPDPTSRSPDFTTFSSILQVMISCYPLIEEPRSTNTSPTCSSYSTPSGSIITVDQSTYSSSDTFNSLSSSSESSIGWIPSTTMTSSISESDQYYQKHVTNRIRRVSCSGQTPFKNGYLPTRCPVSHVGLSHTFTLGRHSCSSSTSLTVDHHERPSATGIEKCNLNDLSPSPLPRYKSTNRPLPPAFSSSLFLPSMTNRIARPSISHSDAYSSTSFPVFVSSSLGPHAKAIESDSCHHLDEID